MQNLNEGLYLEPSILFERRVKFEFCMRPRSIIVGCSSVSRWRADRFSLDARSILVGCSVVSRWTVDRFALGILVGCSIDSRWMVYRFPLDGR